MTGPQGDERERFFAKVTTGEGCWEWTGAKSSKGYGVFGRVGRRLVGAHRYSWEITNGAIPDGLSVLHRCDNPSCVRPDHLFLGTQADNMADMRRKGRGAHAMPAETCPRGHPRTPENRKRQKRGGTECRLCAMAHQRKWREGSTVRQQERGDAASVSL